MFGVAVEFGADVIRTNGSAFWPEADGEVPQADNNRKRIAAGKKYLNDFIYECRVL